MKEQETQKQNDLRGLLEYQTTTTQSMIREIEDLKAIHYEQLDRVKQTEAKTYGHADVSEERYLELEKLKSDLQKRCDQALGIKREINLRSTEARNLREEVTNLQIEKEKMLDQVAKSND